MIVTFKQQCHPLGRRTLTVGLVRQKQGQRVVPFVFSLLRYHYPLLLKPFQLNTLFTLFFFFLFTRTMCFHAVRAYPQPPFQSSTSPSNTCLIVPTQPYHNATTLKEYLNQIPFLFRPLFVSCIPLFGLLLLPWLVFQLLTPFASFSSFSSIVPLLIRLFFPCILHFMNSN